VNNIEAVSARKLHKGLWLSEVRSGLFQIDDFIGSFENSPFVKNLFI
jgi:hypothetical protein